MIAVPAHALAAPLMEGIWPNYHLQRKLQKNLENKNLNSCAVQVVNLSVEAKTSSQIGVVPHCCYQGAFQYSNYQSSFTGLFF